MNKKPHLIMPMGGAGSRFYSNGYMLPKPLIEIAGKPFLYWAAQSIINYVEVCDITFVVLKQHIENNEIDKIILENYPSAKIEIVPEVLPGPVLTCLKGIKNINDDSPIIFNDCDHMFRCDRFNKVLSSGSMEEDAALLTFESSCPQFSYVRYDHNRNIVGTVEKQVVSNHAICGAYCFKNVNVFREATKEYLKKCIYSEYFVSGIYNVICKNGQLVRDYLLDFHVEFGTPEEYKIAQNSHYFIMMEK